MKWTLFLVSLLYVALNALFVKMNMKDLLTPNEKKTLLEDISAMKSALENEETPREESVVDTSSVTESEVEPVVSDEASVIEASEEAPAVDIPEGEAAAEPIDFRAEVEALLEQLKQSVEEEDIPEFCRQMTAFFDAQERKPYYLKMDLSKETEDVRTVLIGDTHCDPVSLSGILRKLLLSDYDYFGKGRIVFLGDYLDRGAIFFEYVRLLSGLKTLMGDRCILMKGNHELIEFDERTTLLDSMVYPSNTCPLLNEYCGEEKEFLRKFASYFSTLPYYIVFKTKRGTDLFVHGGIPRDRYLDVCSISPETGEMTVSDPSVRLETILDNMIWSDPSSASVKVQGPSARFMFGRDQFTRFMECNRLDRLFRSHEPVENGVERFYSDRLFTVFSNGGGENEYTGYPDVLNPVFGILSVDGDVRFESIFLKRVRIHNGVSFYDTVLYMDKTAEGEILRMKDLHLDPEFFVEKFMS